VVSTLVELLVSKQQSGQQSGGQQSGVQQAGVQQSAVQQSGVQQSAARDEVRAETACQPPQAPIEASANPTRLNMHVRLFINKPPRKRTQHTLG
jgi:hypothetical protein